MKNAHLSLALTAAILLLATPAGAFNKGPPPKKPPMTNKQTNVQGKSAQHGAARNMVSNGKAVVQRGKQSLQSQKENLIRLVGRAEGLKPQRRQLRTMARDATNAYRANRNPATRAAWKQAVAAYMPVRQAHETARGQRDAANFRYQRTKLQREAAVKAASTAAGAAAPRSPRPGRPQIRRQAFIQIPQGFASAAASPKGIYSNVGLVQRPQMPGSVGHYAFDIPVFKAAAKSHYDQLTPTEAGLNRQSGSAGSGGASSGTLPTMPFFIARSAPNSANNDDLPSNSGGKLPASARPKPIRQNAYDDV